MVVAFYYTHNVNDAIKEYCYEEIGYQIIR